MESIDMSDPQTLTVVMSAGAIVVTAVLVYAFSVFGFRQKTYEEALEEQRRRDELLVAAGNRAPQQPPSKAAKTAKKKQQRKKEKAAAAPPPAEKEKGIAAATLGEHAGEHVDFKTTPEIIDEEEAKPEAAKQRKRKGGEKPRPILVNKEAKVHLTRPEDRPRSNSFVEISPRDEIELKHLQDERRRSRTPSETMPSEDEMVTAAPAPAAAESNTSKGKKQKDNEASKQTADSKVKFVDMKVVGQKVEEIRVIQAAEEEEVVKKVESKKEEAPKEERTSPTKRQRKPREEEMPGGAKVMEVMKMATLTDTEIQVLIEILLNKQQSGDQWTKKSQKTDPISLLKKQVEEKDAILIESQQQLQCFTNKCKEIRQEQVSEKMRYQQMEKQYSEKLIAQRNELQAMKNVMQQAHDKHVQEVGQLQSQIQKQQGQDTRQRVIETLGQDNSKLKQENDRCQRQISQLTAEVQSQQAERTNMAQRMQNEIDQQVIYYQEKFMQSERANHEMEGSISQRTEVEHTLQRRLAEVTEELHKEHEQHATADSELAKANTLTTAAQEESTKLKNRFNSLQSSETEQLQMVKELEGKLQEQVYARSGLESKEQDMQRQRDALMLELQELKEVNGKLLSQVRRSEGEGQEDVVQSVNGDHVDDTLKQLNKVQEFEGIVTEKDKHIVMLQGDLYNQQLLVKSLSDDVAQHTERSGALSDELEREKANASALCEEEKRKSGALCEELEREKQNASALCEQFEEEKRKSGALCEELEREKQNASALCEQFEEEKQKSGALCEELEREKQNASAISGDAEQQKQNNSAVSEQLQQQMRDHGALCEQLEEEKRKSGALYGQLDEERQKSGALGGELENERRTCGTLCGELEQQKQKNNTLRERNWKAMEAITATERAASERVAAAVKSEKELMEKALSEHQEEREQLLARALSQQREDTRTLLCRVFPDISIADTDSTMWDYSWMNLASLRPHGRRDQSIFLSEFETQACEALERLKADSHDNLKEEVLKRELSNALARSEKIEGRVQHYKTVLSDTEAMLTELQSSVEAEEKKWKEKLDSVEADLGQERREKHLLQGKLEEVKTAAEGVIELQEKLKVLQVKLKAEEIDREHLKEQLRESNARLSERQTDLESKTTELHDAQQTLGKTDELQQEVTVLRLKVDEEFQGNKQLAQQVIKLTGIVKTGQDALRHEQEHVRRLQAQLQQSNGVASAGGDIDSLKLKVAEQEKQLEQEIMTNKHLTAQLAGSRNAESI